MTARIRLSAAERQEHQDLLFESTRSPATLNALLAEIIVLRKLRDAVRANRGAPPRIEGVMARLPARSSALELPFEVLVKHFTASYSAARADLPAAAPSTGPRPSPRRILNLSCGHKTEEK